MPSPRALLAISDGDANDASIAIELIRETLELKLGSIREGFDGRCLRSAAGKDSDGSAHQPGVGEIDKTRQGGQRSRGDRVDALQHCRIDCFDTRGVNVGRRRGRAGDRSQEGAFSLIAFDAMNLRAVNFRELDRYDHPGKPCARAEVDPAASEWSVGQQLCAVSDMTNPDLRKRALGQQVGGLSPTRE